VVITDHRTKVRQHWHAPMGDRRTKDRLSDAQQAYNRLQAGTSAHARPAGSASRWSRG
jgi:hypothetical protein